jgi:glucose/arabinose dehydrogenase
MMKTSILLAMLLVSVSSLSFAQETPEPQPTAPQAPKLENPPQMAPESQEPLANKEPLAEQQPLAVSVNSNGNVASAGSGEILRLEETIRGNKEQPKVLSIVPWQLPLHQRIDRNENRWAPIKTSLKPMVRNNFLKEINLLEGIQTSQSTATTSSDN